MLRKRFTLNRNFTNGDRYNGDAVEGNVKDGKGEYFWAATGATYTGMWSKDKPHGEGKYTVQGEDGYTYEGEFVNGERSGHGVCIFANGRRYDGEWLGDKMHGKGKLTGAHGIDDFVEYVGYFSEGERNGVNGECSYVNEDKYKGSWLHDKRHGHGELQLSATSATPGYTPRMGEPHLTKYTGEFQNDLPHGIGEFVYSDGSTYKGDCVGFSRQGKGEHRTVQGDIYKGFFQSDRRCGKGVLRTKIGEYNGHWKDGLLEGHLLFRGDTAVSVGAGLVYYDGSCVDGEMTGDNVVAKYRDGSSYKGAMTSGKPNGKGKLDDKRMTIPGIGEVMLCYEGEFVGGVPKGIGNGIFTLVTPDPRPTPPPPISGEIRGFVPSFDVSGRYEGMWVNGLPNNDGKWEWENGQSYRGTVKGGVPHGSGVLLTTAGLRYDGSFNQGFPDGCGKMIWKGARGKEDVYEGTWKECHLDGEGTLTLSEGSTYSGGWRNGIKEGHGVEFVPKKYKYVGEFKNGNHDGKGTIHSELEGFSYEGEFVNNEITGKGKMTLEDGTVFLGGFMNGKPHGEMQITSPTRAVFKGEFKNGLVVGPGVMVYPNGDEYKGEFIDDGKALPLRHGRGVYTFIEGNVLECTWKRNVLHGEGTYTTSTGDKSKRSYLDGVLRTSASGGADVFSPENEFPNTLSEDALRERQEENKRRRVTIRRSLPRRVFAGKATQQSVAQGTTGLSGIAKATQRVAGRGPPPTSTVIRRTSGVAPPAGTKEMSGLSTEPVSSTAENCMDSLSTLCKMRHLNGAAAPPVGDGSIEEQTDSNNSSSHNTSNPLVSRFQEGINKLVNNSKDTTEADGGDKVSVVRPPSSSLCDGNEELMQKAAAIRDSREDEIHLLTEELRRLNERIWQLNFMLHSSTGREEAGTPKEEMKLDQFSSLQQERRGIIEKLHCLVS